jgi:hypothetical protein
VNLNEIEAAIKDLPLEQKEALVSDTLKDLPADAKSRIVEEQLGNSGLVVVMGGANCSVNSDVCVQIQNASNVDLAAVLDAVAQRRKSDRSRRADREPFTNHQKNNNQTNL